jgi:HAE1 family hydrophobic/amphiphilic exporter-1
MTQENKGPYLRPDSRGGMSALAVRRGVTFGMVFLLVLGFGLFSLSRLQLDLYPDISFPTVMIITNYTGASPQDIETLVTHPLEGAVASVKGAKKIRSESKSGVSIIYVEFDWGKNMEQAETEVRRALELVQGYLPQDVSRSMVFAFDPSLQPIVMLMVTGPYPLDKLRRIADDEIRPRLERIPGIASAEATGGLEREIQVVLDPQKIAAFSLDANAVIGALMRENLQLPGGYVEQGSLDFTIQIEGRYHTVEEIGEVVVGMARGEHGPVPVRLKQVCLVLDTFYESRRILEVDGQPAVWMLVRKQSGANTVQACRAVRRELPRIAELTGYDLQFRYIFDQSEFIELSLGNLSSSGLIGVGITFLVLLLFLRNLRASLIVSTAIPLSVVATFAVMDQAHMTLNIISMAGLALAIGMLVDNAIVVLENIFRLRQEGMPALEAAVTGAATVNTAVTASTLTTMAVFVPILFVPGIAGVMFRDMTVTICFSLAVSLVVALTFVPLLSSWLLAGSRAQKAIDRATTEDLLKPLRRWYGKVLHWVLYHRWAVGLGLAGLLGISALLAVLLPTEFITQDDNAMVFISVEAPVGTNLETTASIMRQVARRVEKVILPKERKLIAIDVGTGKGFVSLFGKGVHAGIIRVPLVSMGKRTRRQAEIEEAVRQELRNFPGISVSVAMPFNPMGGEGDIEIQIIGYDLEVSRKLGLELKEKLLAEPMMAEVSFSMEEQKPEVKITFDRVKMAELGLSAGMVTQALSTYFMGKIAGRYPEGGDEYDILVRYDREKRQDISEIEMAPLVTPSGAVVPLKNIARVEVGLGPVAITRLNQQRYTRLVCTLRQQYRDAEGKTRPKDLGRAIARVQEMVRKTFEENRSRLVDFSFQIGGTAEDFMTSMKWLGVAFLVSILLVFMVMASQFESLRQPFIIIFTVPLAAIGVVLMFTLTRSTLDLTAVVGAVMLVGIVVNNGIVMVDAANQLRERGLDRREAIYQAALVRLRPVLMTSLTTILAMVPLALEIGEGSAGWGGMAKAVIGGLLVATVLTLVVVPVVYTLLSPRQVAAE